MRVSDFDFDLPQELIAQNPLLPRGSARLLQVVDKFSDRRITDLPSILNSGDILVFNDTKVIPTRLTGKRGDAFVEITLHKELEKNAWLAFVRGAKRLHVRDTLVFANDFHCRVVEKRESGEVLLSFSGNKIDLNDSLEKYGCMPLPPYIKRNKNGSSDDLINYQTMYARRDGAVASPTAGLHFTPELMNQLQQRGIKKAFVTLHVGAGTFLPVKVHNTDDHIMHTEWGEINRAATEKVNEARNSGGQVVAVGSTSLRLLETSADKFGVLHPFKGETNIFITPGYNFKVIDKLLTNFHLPKSTLFMLVAALGGLKHIKAAYEHAVRERYRFFSYGDASLIEKLK